jgi:hypothetical protein
MPESLKNPYKQSSKSITGSRNVVKEIVHGVAL